METKYQEVVAHIAATIRLQLIKKLGTQQDNLLKSYFLGFLTYKMNEKSYVKNKRTLLTFC